MTRNDWKIYQGQKDSHDQIKQILYGDKYCPDWRNFPRKHFAIETGQDEKTKTFRDAPVETDERGEHFVADPAMIEMVNAALYLRRPLLITGKPGVGKSSLIYSVARELRLGRVLRWPITSRTTLRDGLYHYDAIGRLQEWQLKKIQQEETGGSEAIELDIGEYLRLGPLGTAMLPWSRPRALLIDEIDKGDPDLANDLLNILEEGEYEIPELIRLSKKQPDIPIPTADKGGEPATITNGQVQCLHFPFVVMTSNGERDFPPAFMRRCLHLEVSEPEPEKLWPIVSAHLGATAKEEADPIIAKFVELRNEGLRTNDQLLQAVFLLTRDYSMTDDEYRCRLLDALLPALTKR
jgi:MoxR-like ATPase